MGVIVIEVSDEKMPEAVGFLQGGILPSDAEKFGFGPFHLAIHSDAEMVLDVFKEPELGGGMHVADVREYRDDFSWVVEHSLVCRRTGEMTDCPFIDEMRNAHDEGVLVPGRWVLEIVGGGLLTRPQQLRLTPEKEWTNG